MPYEASMRIRLQHTFFPIKQQLWRPGGLPAIHNNPHMFWCVANFFRGISDLKFLIPASAESVTGGYS